MKESNRKGVKALAFGCGERERATNANVLSHTYREEYSLSQHQSESHTFLTESEVKHTLRKNPTEKTNSACVRQESSRCSTPPQPTDHLAFLHTAHHSSHYFGPSSSSVLSPLTHLNYRSQINLCVGSLIPLILSHIILDRKSIFTRLPCLFVDLSVLYLSIIYRLSSSPVYFVCVCFVSYVCNTTVCSPTRPLHVQPFNHNPYQSVCIFTLSIDRLIEQQSRRLH